MSRTVNYEYKKCDCLHPVESYSTRTCPGCNQNIGHRDLVCPFCGNKIACNSCGRRPEQKDVVEIKATA